MGRKKSTQSKVFGPYRDGSKWRVVTVLLNGTRASRKFEEKWQAEAFAKGLRETLSKETTIMEAVDMYIDSLDLKSQSATSERYRLISWFNPRTELSHLTLAKCAAAYENRCQKVSPGTHHRELKSWATFCKFCMKQGLISSNPVQNIKPKGKSRGRKMQLRFNEAQRLGAYCLESKERDAATAVLMALWLGMRSEEIRCRTVRDIDSDGTNTYLWIDSGKTANAERHLVVPEPLASRLASMTENKAPTCYLFGAQTKTGYRTKTWLLKAVRRHCRGAGVPEVCPHGLRGTWATLSSQAGVATTEVVRALGHGNYGVTKRHYAEPGAEQRGRILRLVG